MLYASDTLFFDNFIQIFFYNGEALFDRMNLDAGKFQFSRSRPSHEGRELKLCHNSVSNVCTLPQKGRGKGQSEAEGRSENTNQNPRDSVGKRLGACQYIHAA